MQYKHTVSQNIIGMTPPFFLDLLLVVQWLGDDRSVMNRASRVSALRVTAAIAGNRSLGQYSTEGDMIQAAVHDFA